MREPLPKSGAELTTSNGQPRGGHATEGQQVHFQETVKRVRCGADVSDDDWDHGYPWEYAQLSKVHWSPVAVARRAAQLLSRGSGSRILDIGSGVGKFCVVATLTAPGIFIGVERRVDFVDLARRSAVQARAWNARFMLATVDDVDWYRFDGFYLYNPFAEVGWPNQLSGTNQAANAEHRRLVTLTEQRLLLAPRGSRVVTYHGFGGEIPRCFRLIVHEPSGTDFIECWEKS
jgi:SAM-dependent methyltransferase